MKITKEELEMLEASLTLLVGSISSLIILLKWEYYVRLWKKFVTKTKKVCKEDSKCK